MKKNLKKVLAVVLVVCMAFSLMAVASAAYTDQSKVKYTTAVGVLNGLGIINGYADGSFNPQGTVTRAEAAKMVAYAVLGTSVAKTLTSSTSSFKDVPVTHWASPYVEYCVQNGIISGRGNGTFDPNGSVTGFELAKMLICAAGYGKNNEFSGANWALNVASKAFDLGVFDGNSSANFNASATREETSLYFYNVILNVIKVTYSKTNDTYSNVAGNKTIGMSVFKLQNDKGLVTGNVQTGLLSGKTNVDVATIPTTGTYAGKLTALTGTNTTYNFDTALADIGQLYSIYYNTDTAAVYYSEKISGTVSITSAVDSASKYNTAFGSTTFYTACDVYTFTGAYAATPVVAGAPGSNAAIGGLTLGSTAAVGTYATYGGQIISYVAFGTVTMQKVTAISTTLGSESITLSTAGMLSNSAISDVVKEYTGIAVGDYVTVSTAGTGGSTNYTLAKVTTVDGAISAVTYKADGTTQDTVTLGGTTYNRSSATDATGLAPAYPATTEFTSNTYTLYLDANGKFITCVLKSGVSASTVVYVAGAPYQASSDYGLVFKVQAVNTAGKEVIYNNGSTNKDAGGVNAIAAGFYKVAVNATTGIATFTVNPTNTDFVSPSAVVGTVTKDDIANAGDTHFAYYYDANVNFIFVSGTGTDLKITKLSGLNAVAGIALAADDMLFFNNTTSSNKTVSTVICNNAFTGATTTATVFVPASTVAVGTNVNGTEYNVYIDGVKTKITCKDTNLGDVDSTTGGAQNVLGEFAVYTIDANGTYDFSNKSTATNIKVGENVNLNKVYGNYVTTDVPSARNATGALVVDLSQGTNPVIYTSLASMQAVNGNTAFTVSYVMNTSNIVTIMYVTAASKVAPAAPTITTANGVTATAVLTGLDASTNVATYTVTFGGTAGAAGTATLANGIWAAAGTGVTNMTRTSDTVLAVTAAGATAAVWQFTVTLTANGTPVPTVTLA